MALGNGTKIADPINTCVTIRDTNLAEQVTGSLEGPAFGSLTAGSATAGGISSDPGPPAQRQPVSTAIAYGTWTTAASRASEVRQNAVVTAAAIPAGPLSGWTR